MSQVQYIGSRPIEVPALGAVVAPGEVFDAGDLAESLLAQVDKFTAPRAGKPAAKAEKE